MPKKPMDFLAKKDWNPNNPRNREKVWIAEEREKLEAKKIEERRREIEREREAMELRLRTNEARRREIECEGFESMKKSRPPVVARLPINSLDLSAFDSASELEPLGMDRLKAALQCRGVKCGGSLQERAARLFALKGLRSHEIDPKLLASSSRKRKRGKP
jgi:hypothetical protein